ncbi:MAG: hypothetical protein II567_08230, partial [Candidatus Riflebacteria bacterium]|nr:hypothetical protein [Candidatus Riflebacteria bacterium]
MNKNEHEKLFIRFFDYVNGFRESDGHFCKLLEEKLKHIKGVTADALFIAKNENWSEEVKQFSVDVPVELSRYKKVFDENLELSPSYEEGITIGYVL